MSIWSKYPVEKLSYALADSERTVAASVHISPGKQILVYGTVLPWNSDQKYVGAAARCRVIDQQAAEWADLCKRCPDAPICVAGDFNSDMGESRRGPKQVLKDVLLASKMYCATEPSRFPTGILPKPPIDHIAMPLSWANARVVSAWPADSSRLSDHIGIIIQAPLP